MTDGRETSRYGFEKDGKRHGRCCLCGVSVHVDALAIHAKWHWSVNMRDEVDLDPLFRWRSVRLDAYGRVLA